jgi:hypothetical protein
MFEAVKESFELRELTEAEVIDLRHGKRISANECVGKEIAGINGQTLIAMLEKVGEQLKSTVVFVQDSHD